MEPSERQNLSELLAASRNGNPDAVTGIWRKLTPVEQERVLVTLLAKQTVADSEAKTFETAESLDVLTSDPDDTAAMAPVEQTELVPQGVEELRALTRSESDGEPTSSEQPVVPMELTEYWSRWRQRWKWSVLVAGWAVTTIFAFTGDTSAFGPAEWVVAILTTAVGGGVLVGTLVSFAIAAISTRPDLPS
jgi:hypothetical protein